MRKLSIFLFAVIIIVACSPTKKAKKSKKKKDDTTTTVVDTIKTPEIPKIPSVKDPEIQNIINQIAANELKFTTFYSKVKTKATIDDKTQSFTTQLRWHKYNKIWMSMSIIGIEGARVLINKDSIKIIDRLNSRNILKPISYIQSKAYVNLTYNDIEKLFLAQPILINKDKLELVKGDKENLLKSYDDRFATIIKLDKQNRITNIFITDKLKNQTLNSDYADYILLDGKYFPKTRNIKIVNDTKNFEMSMDFGDLDISKDLTFPFQINPKYKNE